MKLVRMHVRNFRCSKEEISIDFDDVPVSVAKILQEKSESPKEWDELTTDVRDKKISKMKLVLDHVAAPLMTLERLNEIDPDQQVLGWFQEMEQMMEN